MSSSKDNETLDAILSESLPIIDEVLSKADVPLDERPFRAAIIVVEKQVLEIEGDTKDDFLLKPWFGAFITPIRKWYERRYGTARINSRKQKVTGVISHFDVPYLISVPLTETTPAEDNVFWFTFLADVRPHENPLDWLEMPPPLNELKANRRNSLMKVITDTSTLLRAITNNLLTATLNRPEPSALANGIITHLEKAARDIVDNNNSLAVWELQLACEKAMKVYLKQNGIAYEQTHNLRSLQELSGDPDKWVDAKKAIASLPSERRALAFRYAELPSPSSAEMRRMYMSAIRLCEIYTARLSRKFILKNASFKLKVPPWKAQ